jgi:sugar-specific transcriptional regulator TrmB
VAAIDVRDIVERLSALGLDSHEATVYVHLTLAGPTKASAVAGALKLARPRAYRLLESLMRKGYAVATLERPARYQASPVGQVFDDLLASHRAREAALEKARREIEPVLATLRGEPGTGKDLRRNTFRLLQGRDEVHRAGQRMVREASTLLRHLNTHPGAVSMAEQLDLWGVVMERLEHGVEVRILLATTPETHDVLREFLGHPRLSIRHVEPREAIARFLVADDRELLAAVHSDPTARLRAAEEVAVWTDATDFVSAHVVQFDRAWEAARDLHEL